MHEAFVAGKGKQRVRWYMQVLMQATVKKLSPYVHRKSLKTVMQEADVALLKKKQKNKGKTKANHTGTLVAVKRMGDEN